MKQKLTIKAGLALAFAIFVLSPADDIILATIFGTALFGFGSLPFYILLAASSTISIILWKKRSHRKEQRFNPSDIVSAIKTKQ